MHLHLGGLVPPVSIVRDKERQSGSPVDLLGGGSGPDFDFSTFLLVPTVPFWLNHGEAGDITCAR